MEDPNPLVGGEGHARLRAAGIAVAVGPGAAQARRDHLGHILRVTAGRPSVTLKLAETADGFASGGAHDARLRITGQIADLRVQVMRSTHEAIMVGVGTALADDPALTVRLPGVDLKPLRVVIDTHLRLPARSRLAATARDVPTLVIAAPDAPDEAARRLADLGVAIERMSLDAGGRVDLDQALRALAARGITRVFSEGGPRVAARLIALALADEVALIVAEKPLGRPGVLALSEEARAALSDRSRYRLHETLDYGPDTMRVWERVELIGSRLPPGAITDQGSLHRQEFALGASEVKATVFVKDGQQFRLRVGVYDDLLAQSQFSST